MAKYHYRLFGSKMLFCTDWLLFSFSLISVMLMMLNWWICLSNCCTSLTCIAVCIILSFLHLRVVWARDYKTFFVLNSVEHEILNAHRYKNIKKFSFLGGSDKPRILFFPLINVKMSTFVDILTFMCRKNFMLS